MPASSPWPAGASVGGGLDRMAMSDADWRDDARKPRKKGKS